MHKKQKKQKTKSKKQKTKSKKQKTKSKKQKTKSKKQNVKGSSILGYGKDGCIIDSVSCKEKEMTKENGFVAKIFKKSVIIDKELHKKLSEIDPLENRFAQYHFCESTPIFDTNTRADIDECIGDFEIGNNTIAFMRILEPIDGEKMSKVQYRYLRESLKLLHENQISHGDLPGNVMVDPTDNLPRIIDWENARQNADEMDIRIDNDAFLNNFKLLKI